MGIGTTRDRLTDNLDVGYNKTPILGVFLCPAKRKRSGVMLMNTFYGFKLGQSQDYDQAGQRWPTTMIKVEPMTVAKNSQVSFGHKNKKTPYFRTIKFDKLDQSNKFAVGEKITISDSFVAGDKVKVMGISKGKGFQGVVRRHGFAGGPKTHGQSDRQRHPGSIGQTTTPGRVYKGKRMAGHMGSAKVTVRNLQVFAIKPEENLLIIRGLVPGATGGLLKIAKITKN